MGWSFARLSRELARTGRDIPSLGLSRIESGDRRVDVDDLTALAITFEVSPISLLMPPSDDPDEYTRISGTDKFPVSVTNKRVWSWLNGSYPLNGSVLAFFNHALPAWERNDLEEKIGAARQAVAL